MRKTFKTSSSVLSGNIFVANACAYCLALIWLAIVATVCTFEWPSTIERSFTMSESCDPATGLIVYAPRIATAHRSSAEASEPSTHPLAHTHQSRCPDLALSTSPQPLTSEFMLHTLNKACRYLLVGFTQYLAPVFLRLTTHYKSFKYATAT